MYIKGNQDTDLGNFGLVLRIAPMEPCLESSSVDGDLWASRPARDLPGA